MNQTPEQVQSIPERPELDTSNIWDRVRAEFHCEHPLDDVRLTIKYDSLQRPSYVNQCQRCGARIGQAIKRSAIADFDQIELIEWNQALQDSWYQRRNERFKELRQEEWANRKDARREFYYRHLRSPEWRAKREAVMRRDRHTCRGCGIRPAVEVHHLTYAHLGDELLFELIAVCRDCHERARTDPFEPQSIPG